MPKKTIRKAAKKPARKAATKKAEKPIGKITHFYGNIKVAVAKFSKPPKIGAEVHIKGATTDFQQKLDSAQYEHEQLKAIPKGKQVGIKVRSKVREGDEIFAV